MTLVLSLGPKSLFKRSAFILVDWYVLYDYTLYNSINENMDCNYGRPKGYKQQCYTTDCNASCYNKTFTNKNIK